MKRLFIAQRVRATRKYLGVQVRVEVGTSVRWIEVKVPWRLLNEQYEDVAGWMAHEANEAAREHWEQPSLPLEKWE